MVSAASTQFWKYTNPKSQELDFVLFTGCYTAVTSLLFGILYFFKCHNSTCCAHFPWNILVNYNLSVKGSVSQSVFLVFFNWNRLPRKAVIELKRNNRVLLDQYSVQHFTLSFCCMDFSQQICIFVLRFFAWSPRWGSERHSAYLQLMGENQVRIWHS